MRLLRLPKVFFSRFLLLLLMLLSNAAYAVVDVSVSFGTINILTNQTAALNVTLVNSATSIATGLAFTNTLPTGVVVQSVTSNDCGGTLTATVGAGSFSLSGGSVPQTVGTTTGQCTLLVVVKATTAGTQIDTMAAGSVTTTNQGNNPKAASASLTVSAPAPLTGTKAFSTGFIHGGGTSVVTITLNNPNNQSLNNVSFTDTLPTGLAIATAPGASSTCSGASVTATAGAGSASLSGGTIAGLGSCTVTFTVTGVKTVAQNSSVTNTLGVGAVTSTENSSNTAAISSSIFSVQTGGNLTKVFAPTSILANGVAVSTLTLTLQNRNLTALSGVTLTDSFPAGMVVAATPTASTTCAGGSVTATAGAGSISLSGATVPAAAISTGSVGSCTVTVKVVTTTVGLQTNSMSGTFGDSTGPTPYPPVSTTLTGTQPVVAVAKAFSPTTEAPGGTSTLTLTLRNPFGSVATISSFTDLLTTMGAGFTVAASPAASTTCAGGTPVAVAGSTSITMTSGTIPAATLATTPGTCTITVPIQLASSGLTAGGKNNKVQISGLVTDLGSNTAAVTGTLTVALPKATKAFLPASVAVGSSNSVLTITLANPSSSAASITSFSDNLSTMAGAPGGFTIGAGATTSCTGGTLTATQNTTLISLAGGTIPANGNCTITMPIQVLTGTPVGSYTNTIAGGALVTNRGTSSGNQVATLAVTAASVSKAFSPTTQAAGLVSNLTITLMNPAVTAATITSFTDNLTTMLGTFTVAPSPASSSTCAGHNLSAAPGGTSITMTAGTIPATGSCTITVPVLVGDTVTAGAYTNTIAVGALVTSAGSNATTAPATLTVVVPSVGKVFSPTTAGPGPNTTLIITLTNPSDSPAVISAFTDNLLSTMGTGFSVSSAFAASSTCAGNNLSAAPGATSITMTTGTIPGLGYCTILVPIQIPSSVGENSSYTNTIAAAALTTDQGNNAAAASATLTTHLPTVTKTVSPASVVQGQTATFTITLQNINNPTAATITSFTDNLTTLDAGGQFVVASSPAASTTCVGSTLSAVPGSTSVTLTGGSIPASGSCTITLPAVPLAGISAGSKSNTLQIGALQTSQGSNLAAVSSSVTVTPSLTCGKAYSPASVGPSKLTTLTVTLTHANNAPAFSGLAFSDSLPTGQTVAALPNIVNTCGGTVTAGAGGTSLSLVNGSLPTGATSCTVSVDINAPAAVGNTTNTLPAPTSTEGYTCSTSPTATLTVSSATATNVTMNKAFSPATVNGGGVSVMQLLVDNTAVGSVALSGVTLTDNFPTGMVLSSNPNPTMLSGSCTVGSATSTPGATSFSLSGATIPANTTCTLGVNVSSYLEGNLTNTIAASSIGSSQLATNSNSPSATLTVLRNVGISKYFSPSNISVNGTSTLFLTLFNTNDVVRNQAGFTDTLPAGVKVAAGATTNTCGGTLTATVGGSTVVLAGGTLGANSICTMSVPVTAAATGTYTNTITAGAITTLEGSTNPDPATANLVVVNVPTIAKAFGTSPIASGGSTTLTFTLTNSNATAMTSGTFTDNLVNMSIATPGAASGTCTGASGNLFSAGQTALNFTGLTIPGSGSCTVVVNITSSKPGVNPNTTSGVTTAQTGGTAGNVSNTANLTVLAPAAITKSFNHSTIGAGETTTMTIVVSNANSTALALATTAAYTDIFPVTPGQMQVASPLSTTSVCSTGGAASTVTDSTNATLNAGDIGIQVNGGTIAAGGTCTITVGVTASVAGSYTNTTSTVSGTIAGASAGVGSAPLTVRDQPLISKLFTPDFITAGGTSLLTFTLSNTNVATDLSGAGFTDALTNMSIASAGAAGGTCVGAGANVFSAGATALSFTGLTLPAAGSCTVTVSVTSSVAGANPNTTSGVTTAQTLGAGPVSNTATLSVYTTPLISKVFSPSTITVGNTSTLTITLTNTSTTLDMTLSPTAFTDVFPTSPGAMTLASPLSASTTCTGATLRNSGGTALVAGNPGLRLDGGTILAGGTCTVTVNVTASMPGAYNNTTSVLSTTTMGTSTQGASSTLTVNAAGVNVSGQLYADTNHNTTRDVGESWSTGTTAYVKLFLNCTAPAVAVQTLNAPTGTYNFATVAAGSYCLVVSGNASTASTTPSTPAGWLLMSPSSGQLNVTVGTLDLQNQDFGLYNGSKLSGRVFVDSGAGGGTAVDAIQNGSELGLSGATLTATSAGCSGSCDSATSSALGDYVLWLPAAASGSIVITKTNPASYLSSGGVAGTTGGSYTPASDSVTFTHSLGSFYTGVNFADIQLSQFLIDGVQTAMPGTVVFYPHTFTAAIGGTVSFSLSSVAAPTSSSFTWNEVIYRDSNCNGAIDGGEPLLTGSVSLTAGQTLCLLVKEFVPLGAPLNALNKVTITANFVSGTVSSSISHYDVTTVGQTPDMPLVKSVDKTTASPGSNLTYTLTFTNVSSGTLSAIVVNDATPAFTVFVSAGCGVLPLNLTACTITAPAVGATGNLRFTYTGTLAPNASGAAMYTVQITQ